MNGNPQILGKIVAVLYEQARYATQRFIEADRLACDTWIALLLTRFMLIGTASIGISLCVAVTVMGGSCISAPVVSATVTMIWLKKRSHRMAKKSDLSRKPIMLLSAGKYEL